MKFHFGAVLALIATATAQTVTIRTPLPGDVVTLGAPFVLELDKPNTISPSQSVSVAIGLQSCGNQACAPSDDIFGNIIYAGDYTPELHENTKPPYQNFTFSLAHLPAGNATIHVAHFFLLGAGPAPTLQTTSVNVLVRGAGGR